MSKPRVIAFYLPQFHPTPHNDEWWGAGFTEWTNVAKAKKLYPGHYQPKIPADLGFYDLRLPEVREKQVELAREAGIEGFCYYHYWFEEGKEEIDRPFKEVLASGKPDFPFCLCWANESWGHKFWNKDGSIVSQKILAEQKYLGEADNEHHFYSLLPAFKDKRYLTQDGRAIFMIYQPLSFKGIESFMSQWNKLAIENGLKEFYFIGQCGDESEVSKILYLGFDAVNYSRLFPPYKKGVFTRLFRKVLGFPRVVSYEKIMPSFNSEIYKEETVFPCIIPNWDHTPRSGNRGLVYHGSSPELFKKHVSQIFETTKNKENNLIFLKSWNEWGEGNYLEPDLVFGHRYIESLSEALNKYENSYYRR